MATHRHQSSTPARSQKVSQLSRPLLEFSCRLLRSPTSVIEQLGAGLEVRSLMALLLAKTETTSERLRTCCRSNVRSVY